MILIFDLIWNIVLTIDSTCQVSYKPNKVITHTPQLSTTNTNNNFNLRRRLSQTTQPQINTQNTQQNISQNSQQNINTQQTRSVIQQNQWWSLSQVLQRLDQVTT